MVDYSEDIDQSIPYDDQILKNVAWKTASGYALREFYYRPRAVWKVLEGDQRYVTYMFTWAQTPKELNTWSLCHDSSWVDHGGIIHHSGNRPLTEEQRTVLRWLIRPEVEDKGE